MQQSYQETTPLMQQKLQKAIPQDLQRSKSQSLVKKISANIEELPFFDLLLKEELKNCISSDDVYPISKNHIDWMENSEKISQAFNRVPIQCMYNSKKEIIEMEKNVSYKKIDKKCVHKNKNENVIISKPIKFGNIYCFHMFENTKEFIFDHESDHFQGMLLMEAARQTGLATVHLNGLGDRGRMNLTKMYTDFVNYVEKGEPVFIRSISNPIKFDENKNTIDIFCMVQLIQFGKVCLTTTFGSIGFQDIENINNFRDKSHSINQKKKERHHDLLTKIEEENV